MEYVMNAFVESLPIAIIEGFMTVMSALLDYFVQNPQWALLAILVWMIPTRSKRYY